MPEDPKKPCFVIAPIGEEDSDVRKDSDAVMQLLREVMSPLGYDAQRGEVVAKGGTVTSKLIERLADDPLVIAYLSVGNPNVYYELGIRHALGKHTIQFIKEGEKLPFDVQNLDTLKLNLQYPKVNAFKASLTEYVQAAEATSVVDNPVTQALGSARIRKEGSPAEKLAVDVFSSMSQQINGVLAELNDVSRQIADTTRKPLIGIDEIFLQIHETLKHAKIGGSIRFVGMTLGIGVPHRFRTRKLKDDTLETIDDLIQRKSNGLLTLDTMCEEIRNKLGDLIQHTDDPFVVCLKHDQEVLRDKFVGRLVQRKSYTGLTDQINEVVAEIAELHNQVASRTEKQERIRYDDSIPMQLLIVEKDNEVGKRACVVFHVGTSNIQTLLLEDGEHGFYTEVDQVVEMFDQTAQSLWEAAKPA